MDTLEQPEWREDFRNKILDIETAIRLTYNEKDSDAMVTKMTDYIANLLTSRDTYWKERVRKVVEQLAQEMSKEINISNEYKLGHRQGRLDALQALDNLK